MWVQPESDWHCYSEANRLADYIIDYSALRHDL